jgi:hypothetical protein
MAWQIDALAYELYGLTGEKRKSPPCSQARLSGARPAEPTFAYRGVMTSGMMVGVVYLQTLSGSGVIQTVIGREKGEGSDSRPILPVLDDDFRERFAVAQLFCQACAFLG